MIKYQPSGKINFALLALNLFPDLNIHQMRKIILSLAVSLDGFIEGPNKEVDWMIFDEETGLALNTFIQQIDTILYGRVSYESWGSYNPPENSADFEKNFYGATNKMKKYVFTTSEKKFEGNPTTIKSNIAQTMLQLKQLPGKDIWLYGGAGLISTFVNLNLIDEFKIAVIPVILGDGNPMFKEIKQRVKLKLLEVEAAKSGTVALSYERLVD